MSWVRARRRRQTLATPFPARWRGILRRRLLQVERLSPLQRSRHERCMQAFLHDKRFYGCNGLEVTEEMRVLVAGMACLMILRPGAAVFPRLQSILLYPGAFWVRSAEPDELGLVSDEPELRLGESWQGQRVVLSWEDVEAALEGDAVNVVAHEFAHELDTTTLGAPVLEDYGRWSSVMESAYASLQREGSAVLDEYGIEGPQEFFAVATEAYFQRGSELRAHHPELYSLLKDYYGIETG